MLLAVVIMDELLLVFQRYIQPVLNQSLKPFDVVQVSNVILYDKVVVDVGTPLHHFVPFAPQF